MRILVVDNEPTARKPGERPLRPRAGASPTPPNSWRGVLGLVALERIASSPLTTVAPEHASRSCKCEWDWIELVRS